MTTPAHGPNGKQRASVRTLRAIEKEEAVDLAVRLIARSYSDREIALAIRSRIEAQRGEPTAISPKVLRRLMDDARERVRMSYDRSPEDEAAESLAVLREIRRRAMVSANNSDLYIAIRATEVISKMLDLDRRGRMESLQQQKQLFLQRFMEALDSVGMDVDTIEKFDRALRGMMVNEDVDARRGALGLPAPVDAEIIEEGDDGDGE